MSSIDLSGNEFKVLTVNTHKGFNWSSRKFILSDLKEAIQKTNPDLVFLQEVLGEHELLAKRYAKLWPSVSQYEFLADSIWSNWAYGRNAVYPSGHHGNAILSHYEINQWHNYDVSLNGIERRGLLYCHINKGGRSIHTVCVHLSLRESHRQIQIKKLIELCQTFPKGEPVIVAGDFNDWMQKGHQLIELGGDLEEAFAKMHGKPFRTFPAVLPILRLDRIYTRNIEGVRPVEIPRKPWSSLSDHKPLMVSLDI